MNKRTLLICALGVPALFHTVVEAGAQDTHYWSMQYGNQARLLGGAVIGSADDLSSTFYNPGLLALVEKKELLLAGNVFEFTNIKIKNALGVGRDLSNSRLSGVPSLFAGEVRFGFLGESRLAYSFLTRQSLKLRFEERFVLTGDEIPGVPLDQLAARLAFEQDMNEYWAGVTWAKPLGEGVGLGATTYFAFRNQRTRRQVITQATRGGDAGVAIQGSDFDFKHLRLLWKIGLGARFDRWRLGATITTPSIGLWGTGKAGLDETLVTQDLDQDGTQSSFILADFQDGLPVSWKSPLSIGGGAAYSFGATRLHAAAEWFDGVDQFTVVDSEPFLAPDSTTRTSDVVEALTSVFNFGFGVEHEFKKALKGFASFRTDFSAADKDSEARNASLSIWDIYHFALGSSFNLGPSDFTVGAVFGSGSEPTTVGLSLVPDDENNPDTELSQQLETKFFRVTFVLGFAINFE